MMDKKINGLQLMVLLTFLVFFNNQIHAQKEISAVFPANGAGNINVGILKWSAQEGVKYDLYFGTSANPGLFKSDLDTMEVKPVILELNKKYYWKIAEKKNGDLIRTSKVFTFSTLPITLNASLKYNSFVDVRDYKIYWTITVNEKEWFVQNLDYDLQNNSWYYDNSETNKVYGKLYAGHSLTANPDDICPAGWHIPSQQEWTDLLNAFGGFKIAGTALKDTTVLYWRNSKVSRTNDSGFTILPAGSRDSKPSFSNLGKYTSFWTSTPNLKIQNSFYSVNLGFMRDNLIIDASDPNWSNSIRCVKDKF
jgi:uncharacterized protein (TIGR02145 family)